MNQKFLSGFSVPEVLLSIFVLSVGLTSIIALVSASLRDSLANNDSIIGTDLAQEGIELVRNVRDNDYAAGNNGFTLFSTANKHCRIDWNDADTSLDCTASPATVNPQRYYLDYVGSPGLYQHTGTQGRYSRYIYIDYDTNGGEHALVRSFVYWGGAAVPPANGDPTTCKASATCVYTEAFLTHWR